MTTDVHGRESHRSVSVAVLIRYDGFHNYIVVIVTVVKAKKATARDFLYSVSYRETLPAALSNHRKLLLIDKRQWCCSAGAAIHCMH